jgi:transposase
MQLRNHLMGTDPVSAGVDDAGDAIALEPVKKVARSMRNHLGLILNWFRARGTVSAGTVEGMNYNVKLAMRNAYGFRSFRAIEVALFHKLGALPEAELTHRFV